MKLQKLLSYVRKATDDYGMIDENDHICVGVSGGKDSLSLLVALKALQRFYPKSFRLSAAMVSLGFSGFDHRPAEKLCAEIDVPFRIITTDISDIVFNIRNEKNPCALCSNMRKGALNNALLEMGCNKVALGHNRDDVIETFFLSLFYEGRINTFSPVTFLDRTGIYAIRPLIYTPEEEIRNFIDRSGIVTVKNPCPVDGHTKRQRIKEFVEARGTDFDSFDSKIFSAVRGLPNWRRI